MTAAKQLPTVPMSARQLSKHLGVSRATAYRIIERTTCSRDPDALAAATTPVVIGKGAVRVCKALAVPVGEAPANDDAGEGSE